MLTLLLSASLALAKPAASSVAEDADGKHGADLALDGLLATGWGEGGMGTGEGAWWEFDLASATKLEVISIWPGNLKDGRKSFREYARPKTVKILVDGKQVGEDVRIQDEMKRVDVPVDVTGKKVRIEVVDAYEGFVFADCYIAEVAVNLTEGERARAVEKVEAWRSSKEAEKLLAKHEDEVVEAFRKHREDEDENEALAFLMSAAGDGPLYLRKKVGSLVPEGYRVAAIVPDPKAMDALRKLKDPNGIPGLEMAALRSIGKQQREIQEVVEMFYAYQEMVGARRNIAAWGETGFEVGALRSFGEPLAVEVDRMGRIYVADTGNHRVQQFDQDGISQRQWGPKPDIANVWFGKTRKWYASGSAPGDKNGEFSNPVDVELIPGKEDDRFAVLDAHNRLQVFDEQGMPLIGWTVSVDDQMEPRVGGEGYLAWLPKKKQLVAFVGNDAVVYTLESEEVGRWQVKDGTPNAVEVGADGKLYLAFGSDVIAYNADGFRYGKVFGEEVLGQGFEDLDITMDEEGKMWALTDTGWVFKFKKPGKLDWKVRLRDVELEHPRFAVSQGLVFVSERDKLLKIDALQLHTDEVEELKAKAEEEKAAAASSGKAKEAR